jgi:hypothetical protein
MWHLRNLCAAVLLFSGTAASGQNTDAVGGLPATWPSIQNHADGHCQVALEKSDVGVVSALPGRNEGGASWLSGAQAATVSRHVSNRFCRSAW